MSSWRRDWTLQFHSRMMDELWTWKSRTSVASTPDTNWTVLVEDTGDMGVEEGGDISVEEGGDFVKRAETFGVEEDSNRLKLKPDLNLFKFRFL